MSHSVWVVFYAFWFATHKFLFHLFIFMSSNAKNIDVNELNAGIGNETAFFRFNWFFENLLACAWEKSVFLTFSTRRISNEFFYRSATSLSIGARSQNNRFSSIRLPLNQEKLLTETYHICLLQFSHFDLFTSIINS